MTNVVVRSLEQYLCEISPRGDSDWEGASAADIEQVRALCRQDLPPVYEWFLQRLGRSMGLMAFPSADFSARRILSAYADAELDPIELSDRYLMIGYSTDQMMPLHVFHDLEHRVRDDALVVRSFSSGADLHRTFETFAEMLAWGKCRRYRVLKRPRFCEGSFSDIERRPFSKLDGVLQKLGFAQPVATGELCRIYEREDASMVCRGSPESDAPNLRIFHLGARSEGVARSLLGAIGLETGLSISVKSWGG